eukprot:108144-Chlamydomonas_euryale.AAC.1
MPPVARSVRVQHPPFPPPSFSPPWRRLGSARLGLDWVAPLPHLVPYHHNCCHLTYPPPPPPPHPHFRPITIPPTHRQPDSTFPPPCKHSQA